jgi:type II secretory pathway pseudopilin PulG
MFRNLKKAAMFGLDARIALAIFGALSVISGAALYSAIQQAQITRAIVQYNEVYKAIEAYLIDTGANIPNKAASESYMAQMEELGSSVVKGWQGPYLPYEGAIIEDTSFFVENGWRIIDKQDVSVAGVGTSACVSGVNCYYIIRYVYVPKFIAEAFEEKYDSVKNTEEGLVRYYEITTGDYAGTYALALQGPRTL